MALTDPFFWRAFVGPRFRKEDDPYFYDWTGLDAGAAFDPTALDTTTLDSIPNSTLADVSCADLTGWPQSGGVFFGPGGGGQGWEYCDYNSHAADVLHNLVREPAAWIDHNGTHSVSVAVKQWRQIDYDNGQIRVLAQYDRALGLVTWRADLAGFNFPSALIRNHHLCLVQRASSPDGTWTNWLVGWLVSPTAKDSGEYLREWSASIVSLARVQIDEKPDGVRSGDLDIIAASTASGSTPLSGAWKERSSGDYVADSPDFGPKSAQTADDGVWIAEQYVGSPNWVWPNSDPQAPLNDAGVIITGLFLDMPEGYETEGRRWIELTAYDTGVKDIIIGRDASESDGRWPVLDIGYQAYGEGVKIIICENQYIFGDLFPVTGARLVFELRDPDWWNGINIDSDTIAIYRSTLGGEQHGVTWGATSQGVLTHPTRGEFTWAGARPAAPYNGTVLRYEPGSTISPFNGSSTTTSEYWHVTAWTAPGYTIGDYTAAGTMNDGRIYRPYIQFMFPKLGLMLSGAITAGDPGNGDPLPIWDGENVTAEGISAPVTIQIADEQIYCAAKTNGQLIVTTRGYNGTTAAQHAEGDTIKVVQNGVATDGIAVKEIGWSRRAGGIYPKHFQLYLTLKDDPAELWGDYYYKDWVLVEEVFTHASNTWSYDIDGTPMHLTGMALAFIEMSTDPARPRLDAVYSYADDAHYSSDRWIDEGLASGWVVTALLHNSGIPSEAMTNVIGTPIVKGIATGSGERLWDIIADLAEYAGLEVRIGWDAKITIGPNTFYTAASHTSPPGQDIARIAAKYVELVMTGENVASQVRLEWRNGDGSSEGTAVYPTTPDDVGSVQEIGPLVYADSSTALIAATRRFRMARYPYTVVAELNYGNPDVAPGDIYDLSWDLSADVPSMTRLVFVESVEHMVSEQAMTTTINGIIIDREYYA